MADEAKKEPGKLQVFLFAHGEKVALGVAAALFVGYLVYGMVLAEEDPSARNLNAMSADVDAQAGRKHPDLAAPDRPQPLSGEALKPYNTEPKAEGASAWAAAFPTQAKIVTSLVARTREKEIRLADVEITKTEVALDGITLHIARKPVDSDLYNEATVDHFIVERKVGSGSWEKVKDEPGANDTTWTDRAIDPKTHYAYRAHAVTTDQAYLAKVSRDGIGRASNEVTVRSLGIWNFKVVQAQGPPDLSDEKGQAYVIVEKFDKGLGRKVEFKQILYEGDKLGFKDNTFEHRLALEGGKTVTIDFNSGAVLKSVKNMKQDRKFKKCVAKFDPKGGKLGCDIVEDKRSVSFVQVIITDEEKKDFVINHNEPKVEDELCEEHGGKRTAPPDPKKKEEEAKKLLEDADKLWDSDKKKAAAMYQKLRKDYGTTDIYTKNKQKIDDRGK